MALKENINNNGNGIEVDLLRAQRQYGWKQPWKTIQHNKDLLKSEGLPLVTELGRAPLPTDHGDWTYIAFGDYTDGSHHEVLVFGNIDNGSLGDGQQVLTRVHSACRTNEVYHAINCECRKEIQEAMKLIACEGRGIIIYLEQEGRGTGISGKMHQLDRMFGWDETGTKIVQKRDPETNKRIDTDRAYKDAGLPSETRDFTIVGEMLKQIGIESIRLLTNNPSKVEGLEAVGIKVEQVEIHIKPDNDIIASDLRAKRDQLGHHINEEHLKLDCIEED